MDRGDGRGNRVDRGSGSSRPAPSGGRIPPHNLQAEESVLGAILLSREALGAVVEAGLRYDDFYRPAHQHIFDVATAVSQSGGPVDTITVADELARLGLLEQVGGIEALHALQNATPAISNAAYYAKIVQDAAMLRRLIMVAADITELAYNRPDDVDDALDEAESRVFRVADRRVSETYLEIGELMKLAVDRIEENYARGDSITGVATGFTDLDEILSGLQPSTLNIVGARPSVGKALALDTPLPTPSGWTTMGDVQPGDRLLDECGSPCTVTYVSPIQHDRDCFEVVFDDGSSLVADADHQWLAYDSRIARVVTTRQMIDEGVTLESGGPRWQVPLTGALDLPERDLPLDPYALGSTIGDNATDQVPGAALRGSAKQRLAMLQGLMDSHGTVRSRRRVELSLPDGRLIRRAHELVCSLGHKPQPVRERSVRLPDGRSTREWTFDWTPLDPVFRLNRKLDALAPIDESRHRSFTRRAVVAIDPVPSVPVRCLTVDSPHHLYLAGKTMIPTHNTAFGLGVATHVAKSSSQPVLVFSLEMGHVELTQRILASEAEVDSQKIRNGRLSEADWAKIGRAIGRLEVPLFLDDNPRVTVMEIRAKARRLKLQHGGLGLILIDYLQLMSGGGTPENRQLEVSEISRNLKILAREMEVPILALSQLSRNLESRSDKRPMLSDLRESGCVTADTRVLRADTNAEVTIGELVESGATNIPVWSLDRDLRMVPAVMTKAFPTGVKEVFELRLASGRTVKASANHPFLTVGGWLRLDELSIGSRVAVPRMIPDPTDESSWPDDHVILLAHLLGDGCFASGQPLHYTSGDPENIDVVEKAAISLGTEPRRVRQRTYEHLYLTAYRGRGRGKRRNPIIAWLKDLGLYGLRSNEKFVPNEVFGLPLRQVALFLHHLWATEGSLGVHKRGDGDRATIYYASNSRRLIDDVQLLLSRFGVLTRVATTRKGDHRVGRQLSIAGSASMRRFLDEIGVHGARADRVPVVRERVAHTRKDAYCDALPHEVTDRVRDAIAASGLSHAEVVRRAGMRRYRVGQAPIPRWRLGQLAEALDDDFLGMLATSDVHWDRVDQITPLGEQPVFDATVAETHNFVAGGITISNSLEQDSDVVLFLYRDEVYNPQSPDKGAADVIVAKHRAGPTGSVRLVFRGQYARFDNAAPRGMN